MTPDGFDSPVGRTYSEPGTPAVTPGQAALADAWDAQALKCDEAAQLPGLPKAAVLEQSTFAHQLRDCARQLRAAIAARQPQPAPGLGALADELDRLADEHMTKAGEYDRDAAQENFHRGCSAALRNAAGRIRHLTASPEPQPAPELAAAIQDIIDRYPEREPAPGLASALPATEGVYLYHWRFERGEEFGLYWHAADADAQAAKHAGEGLCEVLGMAILGDRPESQPVAGTCPRCGKPALGTARRRLDEARGDLALYGEALREVARRTDGHGPGTTESAVHQVAVSALALNGVPHGPETAQDDPAVPS